MATPPTVAQALRRALAVELLPPTEAVARAGPAPLLNPRRLELVLAAAAYPGIHLRSASTLLLSSLPTVRFHVRRLVDLGALRARKFDRRVCLFVPSLFPPSAEPLLAAWADPSERAVLVALRRSGPLGRAQLIDVLRGREGSVDRAIRRLDEKGAVRIGPTRRVRVALSRQWTALERECEGRSDARLSRFVALLDRQGLRPTIEGIRGDRGRVSVDGPRSRIRFVLPLNPLAGGGPSAEGTA